jgi:type III pantothenate kinase
MLLAIDIGNSDITVGLYGESQWTRVWRIPSVASRPELFYGIRLRDHFLEAGISPAEVAKIVISSVVPDLTDKLINVSVSLFERNPLVLGVDLYKKLPVKVLNPYEIGSDLVANAVAAFTLFKSPCVVVDFGTALTFTTIGATGEILGVAIAPGLKMAIRSLSQNTAKLFDVPLEMPASVLGKCTVHAILAGILFSYEGAVHNILRRIKAELQTEVSTVATGGLSSIIPSIEDVVDRIEPNLTLDGLRIVSSI